VLVETLTVAQQAFYVPLRLRTVFTIQPSSETDEFKPCPYIQPFFFNYALILFSLLHLVFNVLFSSDSHDFVFVRLPGLAQGSPVSFTAL
jgi:hypothetical protein